MNTKAIKHAMVEAGIDTQRELCKRTGFVPCHVSRILNDERGCDPRVSTLKRLCKALGCKAEDIW